MLRAHALSAGIDPDFRVLDELEAERVAADAFDGALEGFLGEGQDPEGLEMVAAYTADGLRDMVRTAYARLRSRGQRRPRLEQAQPPAVAGQRERLADAAAVAACASWARPATARPVGQRAQAAGALRRAARAPSAGRAGRAAGGRGPVPRPQRQGALHGRPATSTATR